MAPALLVLAAGLGSRFGGLKQLEPVGPSGETVLDYSVHDALRAGFGRVVFLVRRDFEAAFRERIGRRWETRTEVVYAHQEIGMLPAGFAVPAGRAKPWGTGHAVWCAQAALPGPFAVVNADDFYGAAAYVRLAAFLAQPPARPPRCALVGYHLGQTLSEHGAVSRGICRIDAEGVLESIEEVPGLERAGDLVQGRRVDGGLRHFSPLQLVSMNCWGFPPALFPELEAQLVAFLRGHGHHPTAEFYLPTAITALITSGHLRVHVLGTADAWCGVTYREDAPRVAATIGALVAQGRYPSPLTGA